jgi:hypothetical protein
MIGLAEAPLKARPYLMQQFLHASRRSHNDTCSSTSAELQMRRKVLQILLRRFRKMENGSSLMEWMMILVKSSSGSSSNKHTADIIKEKGRK